MEKQSAIPFNVATLVCKRDFEQTVAAVSSFVRFCADPFRLALVEDGSLEKKDLERLSNALPGCEVVSAKQADDVVHKWLHKMPACCRYRGASPMGRKLFDVPMLYAGESLFYFDSDVLFFRKFSLVEVIANSQEADVFVHINSTTGYSAKPWELKWRFCFRPYAQINAGIYCLRMDPQSLEFAERFLESATLNRFPFLSEQTIWACGARTQRAIRVFDPHQIACPVDKWQTLKSVVALHFISPVRHLMAKFLNCDTSHSVTDEEVVMLKTLPAVPLGIRDIMQHSMFRHLRRKRCLN